MSKKLFSSNEQVDEDTECICIDCLGDEYLKKMFSTGSLTTKCMACGKSEYPSINYRILVKGMSVLQVIEKNFEIYEDIYPGYNGLSLSEVIGEITRCNNSGFCNIVASYLIEISQNSSTSNEEFFGEGLEYSERTLRFDSKEDEQEYFVGRWNVIAFNLMHRQRYFNDEAEQFFKELFEVVADTKHHSLFDVSMSATIKKHKAGFELYRARSFKSREEMEKIIANPSEELGAPPKEVTQHNRMNPIGIPLFYSALDLDTCIAEIRPSIGDEIAVGKFKITKDLKFFDFCGLDRPLTHSKDSYFLPNYESRKYFRELLSYLHNAIAQPVRPDGNGYVVTQAMAEYLRYKHEEKFDGIIFKSVQNNKGVNYVIFNELVSVYEMLGPDWRPSFPIKCVDNKPAIYKLDTIEYKTVCRA